MHERFNLIETGIAMRSRLRTMSTGFGCGALTMLLACCLPVVAFGQRTAELELRVLDKDSGLPVAARMHLKNAQGEPVIPPDVVSWRDHFVIPGQAVLELRPGRYTFELERGPEYRLRTGEFTLRARDRDNKTVDMERFVDMKEEGWWSGDLHIHRPPDDIRLLMLAEDLHVGPVITWWNDRNLWSDRELPASPLVAFDRDRYLHLMAGEDERQGGALLYFQLPEPLPLAGSSREVPSPIHFLRMARLGEGVHIDIEKPFWRDVPLWLATGEVDSIGLAHNHMWRNGVLDGEAWGRARDTGRYPGPQGNGRWTQDIYYHILNCGLRIPPSAGSASGVLPNPVGYNRVYVHCGPELTYESWWEGLRAGRVFVTNGPMLRPRANGELPGHVFTAPAGSDVDVELTLNLALRDHVDYLEVVQNGRVVHDVRLDDYRRRQGRLPVVTFQESGWILVRAVTNTPGTFRFASSGPFYVEIGGAPRISRTSAQFFVDWIQEQRDRVMIDDPEDRRSVLRHHDSALAYWENLRERANAE